MEDIGAINNIRIAQVQRQRPDFNQSMTDFEFLRTFRFTKNGVNSITDLLAPHIQNGNRGRPLTPLQQVKFSSI